MISLKQITAVIFIINISLVCYTLLIFLNSPSSKTSPSSKFNGDYNNNNNDEENNEENINYDKFKERENEIIEIWSKAAIGDYLWQHVLRANIEINNKGFYLEGSKRISRFKLQFRSGPALTVQTLETFLRRAVHQDGNGKQKNIILILNGRSKEKITFARQWLNELKKLNDNPDVNRFNSGLIILGNEYCFNSWILPYLENSGGPLKFAFVVYDWDKIDDNLIYQWPLGVATYRNFPIIEPSTINFKSSRPYTCNYVATVYSNSSRVQLLNAVQSNLIGRTRCYTKVRDEWQPNETIESLKIYLQALKLSDLTLNPIGINHECYRIFEAISLGSIPVVEENINHVKGKRSACDKNSAFRLLKKYEAPIIYVKNWTVDLLNVFEQELKLSADERIKRRENAIKWYEDFKDKMQTKFLKVIEKRFFGIDRSWFN